MRNVREEHTGHHRGGDQLDNQHNCRVDHDHDRRAGHSSHHDVGCVHRGGHGCTDVDDKNISCSATSPRTGACAASTSTAGTCTCSAAASAATRSTTAGELCDPRRLLQPCRRNGRFEDRDTDGLQPHKGRRHPLPGWTLPLAGAVTILARLPTRTPLR